MFEETQGQFPQRGLPLRFGRELAGRNQMSGYHLSQGFGDLIVVHTRETASCSLIQRLAESGIGHGQFRHLVMELDPTPIPDMEQRIRIPLENQAVQSEDACTATSSPWDWRSRSEGAFPGSGVMMDAFRVAQAWPFRRLSGT